MAGGMAGKSIAQLSDRKLRDDLQELGFPAGPITATTRDVLARKLKRLSLTKTDGPSSKRAGVPQVAVSDGQSRDGAESTKKDLFLSYSRDVNRNNFITKLKKDLEMNGYSVFMDTKDIEHGSDWHSVIGAAVGSCKAMVAVLTAKYTVSQYCRNELFMASHVKKPIFPLLLEEVDFHSEQGAGVLLAIASLNWITFKGTEYEEAFPKLLDGLKHHGVEPSSSSKPEAH